METSSTDMEQARELVNSRIDQVSQELHEKVNKALHANPETCFKEFFAHDTLTSLLELHGFNVTRSSYGLETSFDVCVGDGGRQVVFCAEYDALPEIGHACGHNLIATSSIAAFFGAAHAMCRLNIPGRLRLLGTPAEEAGGGKAKLIDAGAFDPPEDIAAAIMAHPISKQRLNSNASLGDISGLAGPKATANHKFHVEFHGKTAHAASGPWGGTNALDAAVSAYQNVALLRQHIRPDERIHSIFEVGGTVPNIIPDYTRMNWCVRAPTIARADLLLERVKSCIGAGAAASGCRVSYTPSPTYMNLRANSTLCHAYVEDMDKLGKKVIALHNEGAGSTDMGNVSHVVPSFHGVFAIPTDPGVVSHNPNFAAAAATDGAHAEAITCAKGMAMLALRVLADDSIASKARRDFETPDETH